MATVGVRELKNRLSHYLAKVKEGEQITITERGQEVAIISPSPQPAVERRLLELRAKGIISWGGGRPTVPLPSARVPGRGRLISDIVIEERGP